MVEVSLGAEITIGASGTAPLTAAQTEGWAKSTRKPPSPLWLNVYPSEMSSNILWMQNPRAFIVFGRDLHVLVGVDEESA